MAITVQDCANLVVSISSPTTVGGNYNYNFVTEKSSFEEGMLILHFTLDKVSSAKDNWHELLITLDVVSGTVSMSLWNSPSDNEVDWKWRGIFTGIALKNWVCSMLETVFEYPERSVTIWNGFVASQGDCHG